MKSALDWILEGHSFQIDDRRRYRKNMEPPKSGRVIIFIIFVVCMKDVYFCTQEKKSHFSWALLKIYILIIRKNLYKSKCCANKFSKIRGNI